MGTKTLLLRGASALCDTALRIRVRSGGVGVIVNNHTQNGEEIRRQIEALHPYFRFIHHDDLMDPGSPGSKPFCLITFDDGKKVNVDAADTLMRMGVPAAFFIVTEFVGGNEPLLMDKLRAIQRELGEETAVGCSDPKSLCYEELRRRIETAASRCNSDLNNSDPKIAPLSWQDVTGLDRAGFTVGAHSTKHAILTNESPTNAKQDIRESMRHVSTALGKPCKTFAFTNGNFNRELALYAKKCGAETVMTTEPIWVSTHDPAHLLPRIQLHEKRDPDYALLKLAAARAQVLLRDPNGTGRRYVWRRLRQRAGACESLK